MATIPLADSLSRSPASVNARVSTANIDFSGLNSLSTALRDISDTGTRFQASQAASEFMKKKIAEDNAYEQDQEFGTIEERYTRNVTTALNEAAGMISDGEARNNFLSQYSVQTASGIENIKGVAFRKEADYQGAYVNEQLLELRDAGLLTESPLEVMDTATGLVASAMDQGYITAEQAQRMNEDFRNSLASGKLETLAPRDRLEALKEPWAANLPLDTRITLQRTAETEIIDDEAIANVDLYMATITEGGTRDDVQTQIEDITDPDIRAATERRFENEFIRYEKNLAAIQEGLHKEYFEPVRSGTINVDAIPREDIDKMEPSVLNSLYAAESQAASGTTDVVSSRTAMAGFFDLKALVDANLADPMDLRAYVIEHSPELGKQDFEDYMKVATEGIVPPEITSLLNAKENLNTKLKNLEAAGLLGDDVDIEFNRMYVEFDNWYRGVQAETGKTPNDTEVEKHVDRMILDVSWRNRVGATKGNARWQDFTGEEKTLFVNRIYRKLVNGSPEEQAKLEAITSNLPAQYSPDQFLFLHDRL